MPSEVDPSRTSHKPRVKHLWGSYWAATDKYRYRTGHNPQQAVRRLRRAQQLEQTRLVNRSTLGRVSHI